MEAESYSERTPPLAGGEYETALSRLRALQDPCRLCPRECGARRSAGERGFCRLPSTARVGSSGPHFGEESVLVGQGGSGTIFLSGCNLGCVFCQNDHLSRHRVGEDVEPSSIMEMMRSLARQGCENVNFVTPTHFAPQVAEAIIVGKNRGLSPTVVYNCGGYESVQVLRELDGLIDIYMPDVKFLDPDACEKYLGARDYPERVRAAVKEMQRQVGDLCLDEQGLARRGLLARHLVMPDMTADSRAILEFIATEVSPRAAVNIMPQYRPVGGAKGIPELSRRLDLREYLAVCAIADNLGLRRLRD